MDSADTQKHRRYDADQALAMIWGMDEPSNSDESDELSTDSEYESQSDEEFDDENDHGGRVTTVKPPKSNFGKRKGPRTRGGIFRRGYKVYQYGGTY